ncbi:MAG: TIGR03936 family radical SAM-associated protein [Bacillota bacterium]|nr:TIGR03936 family radical SAM-associated protein [Bacillota bacterium]
MNNVIRFQFTKGEEVRYLSHLDLLRTMERAGRRAGLPIAFSQGFTARPLMSFSFPLPVGVLSEAEYADFTFAAELGPEEFVQRYNEHLPPGLQIVYAARLPEKTESLQSWINAASWRVSLPGTSPEQVEERWRQLQAVDSFVVNRETKKGSREVDIRPFVYDIFQVESYQGGTVFSCRCGLGTESNLRMEELGELLGFSHLEATVTRTGQFKKVGNSYFPPLGNRG